MCVLCSPRLRFWGFFELGGCTNTQNRGFCVKIFNLRICLATAKWIMLLVVVDGYDIIKEIKKVL
ncbi:hypothetical protein CTM_17137 [Clostridium tetanomorphum DSM 665]|nr:hypothetical protein CTM_17137 [Clostridium tetanomorphum DSM 665]